MAGAAGCGVLVVMMIVVGMVMIVRVNIIVHMIMFVRVGRLPGDLGRTAGALVGASDKRLVHDPADGAGTAAALGAAAETAINLAGHARAPFAHHIANLVI